MFGQIYPDGQYKPEQGMSGWLVYDATGALECLTEQKALEWMSKRNEDSYLVCNACMAQIPLTEALKDRINQLTSQNWEVKLFPTFPRKDYVLAKIAIDEESWEYTEAILMSRKQ